ncbi:hypothetical protein [Thermoclostridium stercorarium]|uniref:beta-xylosidase family glycoside hydrolase n=1 Tax=Thermoclostridium stercorarium TaxID=1510 RepID=UPI000A42A0DE|nr:hypothetical protein [Thermoclostridium stercorarium]
MDNWPLMGCDGEPVTVYRKPRAGKEYERTFPQTSDEFDGPELGLQWQWNHNPVNERWSLSKRPGYLTLEAMYAESLLKARNTLTQKLIGEKGTATTELNTENLKNGQRAGLAFLGGTQENWIGIVREGESSYIKAVTAGIRYHGPEIETPNVWFRAEIDLNGITQFYFSTDNENFIQLGGPCRLEAGFWKGARIALFSYNTVMDGGRADFNWFRYEFE